MTPRHALLQRQLKRHGCDPESLPEPWRRLIEDVNEAYRQSDADRKLLERSLDLSSNELLQASADMRAVLQAFPDLFFRLGADGTIVACKSSAEGGLIASPSALVGKRIQDVPDQEVRRRFDAALAQVRARQQMASLEYDLGPASFEARLVPMGSAEIIAIVRDITERRRTELALRQREEELRQSQKMEAIGRLAGGVAHDFNNLLTILLTCGEMLEGRVLPEDQDTLDVMTKTVGRAADLTRQLLTFSRRQLVSPQVVPIDEAIRGVLPLIQRTIGELIEVRAELDSGAAAIEVDPGQIEQIVLNLVLNARDAMPRGGRITIATTAERCPPRTVRLCVRDTGVGMSEATRLRVFEPFFTTKEPGKGTGLGLSTVHGIVTQAGGTIDVRSEPGAGTEFRLHFPLAARGEDAASEAAPEQVVRGGVRVLLVEDDVALRRGVRKALEAEGHVVIESDPHEAIELCRTSPGAIDLLLTDVVMPGMCGRELARLARSLAPELRILLMSGHEEEADAGDSLDLIRKPFGTRALAAKIREVLAAAAAT